MKPVSSQNVATPETLHLQPAQMVSGPDAPLHEGATGENLKGAMIMMFAVSVYTANDATMKFVAEDLPLYQSIALRSLFSALILLAVAVIGPFRLPRRALREISRRDAWLMGVRLLGEIGSTLLYLTALTHMALGEISAISQSTPLFVVLAAAVFLRERVGWRRLVAIVVGMIGVIIILRPGTPRFDIWAVIALIAVLLVVVRDVSTRLFSAVLPPMLVAISAAVGVGIFATLMALFEPWVLPDWRQLGLLWLAAGLVSLGYFSAIMTIRVGDISFSAPFRYISLVVAVALGYVIFGEFPDLWTWVGAGMIISAGCFVIWRETRQQGS